MTLTGYRSLLRVEDQPWGEKWTQAVSFLSPQPKEQL